MTARYCCSSTSGHSASVSAVKEETTLRVTGTRDELIAELDRMSEGWWHLVKRKLYEQSVAAANELRNGATTVQAGHTTYTVTDGE